jgi:hypothetical protein
MSTRATELPVRALVPRSQNESSVGMITSIYSMATAKVFPDSAK